MKRPSILAVTAMLLTANITALADGAFGQAKAQQASDVDRVNAAGQAFIASIAYSAYLIQKIVMHLVGQFCFEHNIALTSAPALVLVEICVYAAGFILFLLIERPFLQLRHRLAPRKSEFSTSNKY